MYRKEIVTYSISTVFVFLAAALHLMDDFNLIGFSVNAIVFFLYTAMILLWEANMESRILRTQAKKRFRLIAFLLIGYLFMRTIKYEILYDNLIAIKYLRYGYYFFTLNIVHLVFFTSLLVAKSETEAISKYWHLLWIPTEALVLMVLTNDIHGLAFKLDVPLSVEAYGPLFYIILLYITLLALASIISAITASRYIRSPWPIVLPITILVLWAAYTFLYILDAPFFHYVKVAFKSAEFNILVVILFIESLVFTRLIPSNRGYERFLKLSSLKIGMMNKDGEIVLSPEDGHFLNSEMIENSLYKARHIDKDTLLESAEIKGGMSFWFIDLKELNMLKEKLYALNESLMNENEILTADKKLRENMAKLEEQNEIRSYIDTKLSPKFDRLKDIVNNLPDDEAAFESAFKKACLTTVYIKRYSNLFLLSKEDPNIALAELGLAFNESLNYLRLSSVETSIAWQGEGTLDIDRTLAIYETFQNILELHYPDIDRVDISLEPRGNLICIMISIGAGEIHSLPKVNKCLDLKEDLQKGLWLIKMEGAIL